MFDLLSLPLGCSGNQSSCEIIMVFSSAPETAVLMPSNHITDEMAYSNHDIRGLNLLA